MLLGVTAPKSNGSGNLPATTPRLGLRRGNPGNKGGADKPEAFRIRARQRLAEAKGLEVVSGILQNPDEKSDTRLKAFRELRESAGYIAPALNVAASGEVKILVVYDE